MERIDKGIPQTSKSFLLRVAITFFFLFCQNIALHSLFSYWDISSESGCVEPAVSTVSVVSRPKAQWTAGKSLANGVRKVSELYQLSLQY